MGSSRLFFSEGILITTICSWASGWRGGLWWSGECGACWELAKDKDIGMGVGAAVEDGDVGIGVGATVERAGGPKLLTLDWAQVLLRTLGRPQLVGAGAAKVGEGLVDVGAAKVESTHECRPCLAMSDIPADPGFLIESG